MENFDIAREALDTSLNSSGSALREHAKWSESLEAKLLKLQAAWQSLSQSVMGSDFLKNGLDFITGLVDGLDKLANSVGVIPTLLTAFAAFKSISDNKGIFKTLDTELNGFINKIGIANNSLADLSNAFNFGKNGKTGFSGFIDGLKSMRNAMSTSITQKDIANIQAYNNAIDACVTPQTAFNRHMQDSSKSAKDLVTNANGSKVALKGMTAATKATKVALIGAKVAAVAFNAALTMGISLLVDWAVTGIMKLVNAQKELAEQVDDVTSEFREQHDALKKLQGDYDTSDESSMVSRYEKLSKGVDNLGRNVSLTADEYSEYQEIANKIAGQIPSLVSGYDSQGNAILSCKGNVEELTKAYEDLIAAQNREILVRNKGDIEKDFENVVKKNNKTGWWGAIWDTEESQKLNSKNIEILETILSNDYKNSEDIVKYFQDLYGNSGYNDIPLNEIKRALQRAGVDGANIWNTDDELADILADLKKNDPQLLRDIIEDAGSMLEAEIEGMKSIADATLSQAFDISNSAYYGISEELQNTMRGVVNNWDYDFYAKLKSEGKDVEDYINNMLDQINALSKSDNDTIDAAFELQTEFNGGDISYGDYIKSLRDFNDFINNTNLDGDIKNQIKLNLNSEELIDEYDRTIKRLTDSENYDFNISENEAKKLLDGLTAEEYSIAVGVITEMSDNNVVETIDQVQAAIDKELTLQGLTINLDISLEKEKLDNLTSAIGEAVSGVGLSNEGMSIVEDMFGDLDSYDPSKLFERTANGIRLNSQELNRLNDEYAKSNLDEINKEMDSLGDIYNQTREELYNLTYGTDEYNAKAGELSTIEDRIKTLEKLGAQYEGLASSYNQWQMAESAGSQRDMYESIISGFETVDDELSRGWIDDGSIKFLELLTGETGLAAKSGKELKEIYDSLSETIEGTSHSVRDFFTVNEDGESTNAGVYNFLEAVEDVTGEVDVIKRNSEGDITGFDFRVYGGDEAIAEALGVSEELVQIMVRAADDAGFVVSMDGTYQQLDVLKAKAQEAAESLNRTLEKAGKDGFDFNFNSTDVDDITKQLTEAQKILDTFRNTDGTINTKLEGADEALTVASTLQSMLDKLTRPTYMDIEVNQVEDELQKPLQNLQELRKLLETEHQLKLSGADTSELETSKQEVYDYFEGLDPEIKAEIGLVDKDGNPLTGDALKDKLNSGDLNIEATVDIQMKMDDKLGILVDKALLDAGVITEEEFEKRVDIYLNADVDNEDAKNKVDQAVDEVSDGSGNKTDGKDGGASGEKVEKPVDVDVKADEVDTSDITDKTEEAIKNETEKALAVETKVELETTIDEAADLIQKFEDKDIAINVSVDGLDDVKELNQNIDLATQIDGDIDNLTEYVENAKILNELDDNIASFVTAEIKGNVIKTPEYELNNIGIFADGVNKLKDAGSFASKVTADVEGNVIETPEYMINNLKTFADSAKDIGNIGNVESNVKATVNTGESGDVVDTFEYKLDNLGKFADHVQALQNLNDVDLSVNATVNAGNSGDVVEEFEHKLDNLGEFAKHVNALQDLNSVDISVTATVNTGEDGDVVDTFEYKLNNLGEFAEYVRALQGLNDVSIDVNANVNTGEDGDVVDTFEYKLDNLGEFAEHVRSLQGLESIDISVNTTINTGEIGDVADTFEYKLDNLGEFAKYVRDLQGLENVDLSVNATVNTGNEGDVTDTFEYQLNNLGEFAKHVNALQGFEDVDISVTATVNSGKDGDIVEEFEYKLNNLGEFAKHVNALQGLENVELSVEATIDGDVTETAEYKIDNLGEFKKHAAALQDVKSRSVAITANIYGNVPEKSEEYLDDLQVFAQGANALQNTASKTVEITANIYGNVPTYTEGYLDDLQVFAQGAIAMQTAVSKTVNITANVDGNAISGEGASGRLSSLAEFKSLIDGMSNQTVTIGVTAKVDSENINQAITLLKNVSDSGLFKNYSATVQVGAKIATIDDTVVDNYNAPPKEGEVTYSVDENSPVFTWTAPNKDGVVNYDANVEALTDSQKHKSGTITYKVKIDGLPAVNGTANVGGTTGVAFARGNWRTKKSETALTGELGREIVVTPNNEWYTVGDHGAEFANIPKGSIVFNHKQSEELLKYGKVLSGDGRASALVGGIAFSRGTGGIGKVTTVTKEETKTVKKTTKKTTSTSTKKSSTKSSTKNSYATKNPTGSYGDGGAGDDYDDVKLSSSDSSNSSSKSNNQKEEETKDTFDWIEVAISRIERAIDNLDKKASNVYENWSTRNNSLVSEIGKVREEIDLQEKGYERYLEEANKVGLSSSWAEKVREGKVDINTIEDEDLAEKIREYQTWYEKALDCQDAIYELKQTEAELYKQRFDNVSTQYDGILGVIEHEKNMLDEYIAQSEAQGWLISEKYYKALVENEKDNLSQLQSKKNDLLAQFQNAMDSGVLKKNTEGWYAYVNAIDEVTLAIEQSNTALLEYNQTLQQLNWEVFDLIQERISDVAEEANFLIELMSNKKLYEDGGQLTAEGSSTMGLHGVNYNVYMRQADDYAKKIVELNKEIAKSDPYDQELINKRNEYIELQRESILAAEDEKNAIRDMVEEGIQLELEALQELIDKKNEELETARDLYEYNKNIKEQTEEIAALEKQRAAFLGDTSEESRQKIQKIDVSLAEARENLEETERDKIIEDTAKLLDELYLNYETILNTRLDNIDVLIADMIAEINADASLIRDTITTSADNVGYTLSDAMRDIWTSENNVITMYGDDFKTNQTSTKVALDSIVVSVNNMVAALNKTAEKKAETAKTSSAATPTSTKPSSSTANDINNSLTNNIKNAASKGDGTPKKGDKVKFVSGKYYYDSYGKTPLGSKYQGKEVYITNINTKGSHPYHISTGSKLGNGDLGWLKLSQISGYASGKQKFFDDEIAWTQEDGKEFIVRPSDGAILTPVAKGDSVLNASASRNIWDFANSPAEFIKDNLNLGSSNVPNGSNSQNSYVQNLDKVVFNLPNVQNYDELLSSMQKDKNFERLINAMSIDRIAGKSALAKKKAIR